MITNRKRIVRFAAAAAVGASLFQVGGCNPVSSLTGFLTDTFNPCGSILNCDPASYRFLSSGYEGPGFDPSVDPACTFPPFCQPPLIDPFIGGLGP